MSAQGLKRCVEEKESVVTRFVELTDQKDKLQKECMLYKKDIERLIESCDFLRKENEELRTKLNVCNNVSLFLPILSQNCIFFQSMIIRI